MTAVEPTVAREGGVSYLRIPAPEPDRLAAFYATVFGWTIHQHGHSPSFEDGTGHVIGHFMPDLPVAGEAGVLPYVYVTGIDAALDRVRAAGGSTVREPYAEGELWVATVRDPAGNVVGIWQQGPRS